MIIIEVLIQNTPVICQQSIWYLSFLQSISLDCIAQENYVKFTTVLVNLHGATTNVADSFQHNS